MQVEYASYMSLAKHERLMWASLSDIKAFSPPWKSPGAPLA